MLANGVENSVENTVDNMAESSVSINGQLYPYQPGSTILQALQRLGIEVPHLCDDARLQPAGGCRLCVVQVAGEARPLASCNTPLRAGMQITTHDAALEVLRSTNLRLLAEHYPPSPDGAAASNQFQHYLQQYGIKAQGKARANVWQDDSHPYIGVALDRCVYCYRCVRICDEVQGQFVWQAWQRGEQTHIQPASGSSLLESGCTSCGACVDSCPSGALFDKRSAALGEATSWTRSTCGYCGVGCQLEVGSSAEKIVAIRPAPAQVAPNHGHLCVKGRYAFEFNHAPDRITTPMIKQAGQWQAVSWQQALGHIATQLQHIMQHNGADAIGVLGSARATNEDNYLLQKFTRVVLGTNNVDCCARVCHQPSAAALKLMLGTGAATNSFDDIEQANVIMVCGANPTENHPIVGARIKQAVRRGAKLIVIDPRTTELAQIADMHLAVRPGLNLLLFNAIACTIVEEGLQDDAFIAERVSEFAAFAQFIQAYQPEQVAAACGVPAAQIRACARLYAQGKPSMQVHGLGMTEHSQGSEGVMSLINLALLTGNLGKPGSGVNPLRGQNNVQGAAHMGCEPKSLTGGQTLAQARSQFEQAWGVSLPSSAGLTLPQMMGAAAAGKLKAIWACGYDIYLTLANANHTAQALQQLELVIVQDMFLNETAQAFGTVFLPVATMFEKDGTFMNADRRVQRIRLALPPSGQTKADWQIVQELAAHFGQQHHFSFANPEAIWDEIRSVWPQGAGLSYARMEQDVSPAWPCPSEAHPGSKVLHQDSFTIGKQAALRCLPYIASAEHTDSDYPLLLNSGRTLYHFNAGTMSYRTPNAQLQPTDYLDLCAADAAQLEIADQQPVRVISRYGQIVLPARITDNVSPGTLYTTFHLPALFVNRITSPYHDGITGAPEYKVTAVRLQPLKHTGGSAG